MGLLWAASGLPRADRRPSLRWDGEVNAKDRRQRAKKATPVIGLVVRWFQIKTEQKKRGKEKNSKQPAVVDGQTWSPVHANPVGDVQDVLPPSHRMQMAPRSWDIGQEHFRELQNSKANFIRSTDPHLIWIANVSETKRCLDYRWTTTHSITANQTNERFANFPISKSRSINVVGWFHDDKSSRTRSFFKLAKLQRNLIIHTFFV